MDNQLLNVKLLETSINTMVRNRTLLFTINLIAALLLTVVYLEIASFDEKQREGHLIAYKDRCGEINATLNTSDYWKKLSTDEKNKFIACSKPDDIREYVITNNQALSLSGVQLKIISANIYKLHRIQNEMNEVLLDKATAAPLGFGLPIPRNDLVLLCGVLLIILYMWLAFSFAQHARIITKIKLLFPENKSGEYNSQQATVNDLVELNFLFRTNRSRIITFLVKFLYFLAPIAMTIATINDYFFLNVTEEYRVYLTPTVNVSSVVKIIITVILWVIGRYINRSDRITNKEPRELIVLCGLKLGMTKNEVSKALKISVLSDIKDTFELNSGTNSLKDFQCAEKILLNFSEEKITLIEITYSNNIQWNSSEEFARRLSKLFDLSFDSWNLSASSNRGEIEFEDFTLKIDSRKNQITLIDKKISEEESKKKDFEA